MDCNIKEITEYIKQGESDKKRLGVELEHFILDDELMPAAFDDVEEMLIIASKNVGELYYEGDRAVGLKCSDYVISLEPAAQLEISIKPMENISNIVDVYKEFRNLWDEILKSKGYHFVNNGVHPLVQNGRLKPTDFELIPKNRYKLMDEYFKETGKHGAYMMRATASTQVSIDYSSEEDFKRKFAFAEILAPILSLIAENRCNLGTSEEFKPYLFRNQIWADTDKDRCGYVKGSLKKAFSYEEYANYVFNNPIVVWKNVEVPEKRSVSALINKGNVSKENSEVSLASGENNEVLFASKKNIKDDTFKGESKRLNQEDVGHILSMFFPHVRMKQYIEIRMADSLPLEKMAGFAALIKGLFYNEGNLCKLRKLLSVVRNENDIIDAENEIMEKGFDAFIYGRKIGLASKNKRPVKEWISILFEMAKAVLPIEEAKYLKALKPLPVIEYELTKEVEKNKEYHTQTAEKSRDYILSSTAKYHERVVKTMYLPKLFKKEDTDNFAKLIKDLYGIFDKVFVEYKKNPEYRKLFGFSKELEKLILRENYSSNIPIARIDIFYDDATKDFKFCEFNTDGTSAMNEDRELVNAVKFTEGYNCLVSQYNVKSFELFDSFIDEFLVIYKEYRENDRTNRMQEKPNVAIIDFMESATSPEFEIFKGLFEKRGLACEICEIRDIEFKDNYCFTISGMRIDAIYRRAVTSDILNHLNEIQGFMKGVENDAFCLIGDFKTQIAHNKILYQILHLDETKRFLTKAQQDFVKAHVPLTVKLSDEFFDNNPGMKEKVLENKDDYIIKPEDSYGSKGVHAGVECKEDEWKRFVEECINDNYILQEFNHPYRIENIDLNETSIDVKTKKEPEFRSVANLTGLFTYNGKFAGVYSRISFDEMISTQYNEMSLPTLILY